MSLINCVFSIPKQRQSTHGDATAAAAAWANGIVRSVHLVIETSTGNTMEVLLFNLCDFSFFNSIVERS